MKCSDCGSENDDARCVCWKCGRRFAGISLSVDQAPISDYDTGDAPAPKRFAQLRMFFRIHWTLGWIFTSVYVMIFAVEMLLGLDPSDRVLDRQDQYFVALLMIFGLFGMMMAYGSAKKASRALSLDENLPDGRKTTASRVLWFVGWNLVLGGTCIVATLGYIIANTFSPSTSEDSRGEDLMILLVFLLASIEAVVVGMIMVRASKRGSKEITAPVNSPLIESFEKSP